MDNLQKVPTIICCIVIMKLSVAFGEKYAKLEDIMFVVPGSWTMDCPDEVHCTVLYCASQCTYNTECRSFSYSRVHRQCVFTPWYFSSGSVFAIADSLWSTYERKSRECDSQPCQNGGTCTDVTTGKFTCTCVNGFSGDQCQNQPVPVFQHCKALLDQGTIASGVYTVYPDDVTPVSVYCDQDTDGGGWVVFQRRQDGSEDFDRSLPEYQTGFGDMQNEFWLGLDTVRMFTSRWTHELRVDMSSSSSSASSAVYSNFNLDSSYTLNYDAYTGGSAGNCFAQQKGYAFSAPPVNDMSLCSSLWYGCWWYADSCMYCNLNGRYGASDGGGVKWYTNPSGWSVGWSEMKIRPTA